MKKLVTAACALVAGIAMADGVTSANTVGYNEMSPRVNTFELLGFQYENVGTPTGAIDLNSLLKLDGVTPSTVDNMTTQAAQIQIMTDSGYALYYYVCDPYDEDPLVDDYIDLDAWCDADEILVTEGNAINAGVGFWFKVPTAAVSGTPKVTFKGQVIDGQVETAVPANIFKIVANPFPTAMGLNEVTVEGIANPPSVDNMTTQAAQIQIMTDSGYALYYYVCDPYDEDPQVDDYIDLDAWCDADEILCTGTQIDAGRSFWIKSPAAITLSFNR